MTSQDFLPRVRTFAGLLRDVIYMVSISSVMLGLMAFGLYSWQHEKIISTVRGELGIEDLATQQAIADLSEQVSDLAEGVRRATGEDRVIRQPAGLSYVEEPVTRGDRVILWLTVARTKLGKNCRLTEWTPLFTDAQNVSLVGSRPGQGSVRRQISDDFEKLRVELIPPEDLIPGRIELYLTLDYLCDGKRVPDRTDVVTYRLTE